MIKYGEFGEELEEVWGVSVGGDMGKVSGECGGR